MGMLPWLKHAVAQVKACRNGHVTTAKACMLPWPRQPRGHAANQGIPMGTQPEPRPAVKAKGASMGRLRGHACCHAKGSLMGMQPRARHAAAMAKVGCMLMLLRSRQVCCNGHTAKAKACSQGQASSQGHAVGPREPHGHAAKAKACSHG